MIYELIKDIPTAKKGVQFKITETWWISLIEWQTLWNIFDLIKALWLDNIEYFKIIEEKPKSIFDLKYWDEAFYIDTDLGIIEIKYYLNEAYSEIFLTREEAEKEAEKRKAIFNIKKYCYDNNIEIREFPILNIKNFYIVKAICNYIYNYCVSNLELNTIWFFKNDLDASNVIDNCKEDLNILFNIK